MGSSCVSLLLGEGELPEVSCKNMTWVFSLGAELDISTSTLILQPYTLSVGILRKHLAGPCGSRC